jgi:hypothetical protein
MGNTPDRYHADLQASGYAHPDTPLAAAPRAWWADDDQGAARSLVLGQLHHVDQRWLRHINRALVLACLHEHGPISRVEIAARTALSRTTVSAITNALLREGVVREGERMPAAAQGGRRAVLLHAIACHATTADELAGNQR